MHYYQFNVADYRKKTGYLTLVEHAIYRSLIDTYYLEEAPLCVDTAKLMRTHSIRTESEKESFNMVLNDFFTLESDGYHHEQCDEVLAKIYNKSEKARKSAKKRWAKDAKAMRTHSEGNAKAMLPINPIPINPIPNIKDKGDKSPAKAKRFVEPSILDVQNYFLDRTENRELSGNEGIKFHAFYESKGWLVGKSKMKDWKASVRGWITRMDNRDVQKQKKQVVRESLREINNTNW